METPKIRNVRQLKRRSESPIEQCSPLLPMLTNLIEQNATHTPKWNNRMLPSPRVVLEQRFDELAKSFDDSDTDSTPDSGKPTHKYNYLNVESHLTKDF